MPLYEYECDEHGHRFEVIQKFSDPPIEVCPTCGGHVHKVISSPAFQFKGSGWYITDYARKDSGGKGSESGEKGDKEKGEKTESKDTSKTSDKDSAPKKTESTSGPETKSST